MMTDVVSFVLCSLYLLAKRSLDNYCFTRSVMSSRKEDSEDDGLRTALAEVDKEKNEQPQIVYCSAKVVILLVVVSACTATADFVWAITGVQTPANVQSVLVLLEIPFVMVLSMLLLKAKYGRWYYAAAIFIIGGASLAR
jgi:hypothetical protein